MKVRLLWGNPIAIVLISIIFSITLITISVVTLLSGQALDEGFIFFTAFITLYNLGAVIVFYIAYKREMKNSKHAFMSPKQYKRSVKLGEQYESTVNRLRSSLRHMDGDIEHLDDDAIIDRIVEVIEGYVVKSIKD